MKVHHTHLEGNVVSFSENLTKVFPDDLTVSVIALNTILVRPILDNTSIWAVKGTAWVGEFQAMGKLFELNAQKTLLYNFSTQKI